MKIKLRGKNVGKYKYINQIQIQTGCGYLLSGRRYLGTSANLGGK